MIYTAVSQIKKLLGKIPDFQMNTLVINVFFFFSEINHITVCVVKVTDCTFYRFTSVDLLK